MSWVEQYFRNQAEVMQMLIGLTALGMAAFLARLAVKVVLVRALGKVRAMSNGRLPRALLDDQVLRRFAQVVPSLVVQLGIGLVPHLPATPMSIIRNVALALTAVHVARTITLALSLLAEQSRKEDAAHNAASVKGTIQLINIILYAAAVIVIIAALMDRSPLIVLSGMGAFSAVLMLVFKDTILSFTAGLLINSNDMLRIGDWIEMPQAGADGSIKDIALHTVKVQNWDLTITTIPTWKFVSESYKNWRGMSEAGGRRIKRALRIDAGSVRFLTAQELQKLSQIQLIHDYLQSKAQEVAHTNQSQRQQWAGFAHNSANERRLTNIGTFRAYALAYLQARPDLHKGMTMMVRQLEPSAQGIPLELYCFTSTTAWTEYEGIQSDIFDHLLAILPEFGLRGFQSPSGADLQGLPAHQAARALE